MAQSYLMTQKKKTVAVIGATGAVGREIVRLLMERNFPCSQIRCFASARSIGKEVHSIPIEELSSFSDIDLAFFCAGSALSKQWIPIARKAGVVCIDSSSAFRFDAPLIIPEINQHALKNHEGLIASPNCAATILLMPLFPLHRLFGVKRVIVSTYQAASGGGAHLVEELKKETESFLTGKAYSPKLPFPYAFNLYPHNSALQENGYVDEELKIRNETRKILEDETIQLSATCVRVPVLRAHSISANVEFKQRFELDQVKKALASIPGLKIFEDPSQNRFATPLDASGQNDVFCGRFRIDPSQPNTLEFWSVGDQLLKGAALNAVQIAEVL